MENLTFSFAGELDVRDNESVKKFVASIPKELSDVDILVNNAGLALGIKHAFEMDLVRGLFCDEFRIK